MKLRNFLALTLVGALLLLAGCQGPVVRRSTMDEAVQAARAETEAAQAELAASAEQLAEMQLRVDRMSARVGCMGGGVPARATDGPWGAACLPDGVYLASTMAYGLDEQTLGFPVLVIPGYGHLRTENLQFVLYHYWTGLEGRHTERIDILAPDGAEVLATETADMDAGSGRIASVGASRFYFQAPYSGWYQVAVALDDMVVVRYTFRVDLSAGGSDETLSSG